MQDIQCPIKGFKQLRIPSTPQQAHVSQLTPCLQASLVQKREAKPDSSYERFASQRSQIQDTLGFGKILELHATSQCSKDAFGCPASPKY